MIQTLEEARALLDVLMTEVDELAGRDSLTEEQEARFNELVDHEVDAARQRVEVLEERARKIEEIREASLRVGTLETSDQKLAGSSGRAKRDPFDFSTLPMAAPGTLPSKEFRARAHDAIEQSPEYVRDEAREAIATHVDRDRDGIVAAHCLSFGSEEYTDKFLNYLRTGEDFQLEARTTMSTTAANGGYMIPFFLDPTIILTNAGTTNPFRKISNVVTITSNVWHGITSAGVTAEWLGENSEAADASPTFVQPTITPGKAAAYVEASYEVMQDTNIGAQLPMLFSDAKDRIESTAFATGSGSGQPKGIVTALQAVTASRVASSTNASFGLVDVYALVNNLPPRYQDNCDWVAHWGIFNLIRQFGVGSVGQGAFWTDLGPGIPSQLLSRPTYSSSVMTSSLSSATASNDDVLILGDFRDGYTIVDRIGMEVKYNDFVIGTNRRPVGASGWAAFWRVGADAVNTDAFRMLRV